MGKRTINERNTGTVRATFAHTVKVSVEKFVPTCLETILNHFGRVFMYAILSGIANNGINGTGAVGGRPVLAKLGLEILR